MTDFSDAKIKHLDMLQRAIDRMAAESARMKQVCLLSIAALASAASATGFGALGLVAALLTLVFWGLDAMYLRQERWFRALYDEARANPQNADFVMTPSPEIRARHSHSDAMLGWSVAFLYGAMILLCIGLYFAVDNMKQ